VLNKEAAAVKADTLRLLENASGLTISFDGWTAADMSSLYGVNIIFPDGRVRLWETLDLSLVVHNADNLASMMINVIKSIGPEKVAMLVSDNGGAMPNARRKVVAAEGLTHILEHR
jgi:hypothetical protein